jgi:hypothetical protein
MKGLKVTKHITIFVDDEPKKKAKFEKLAAFATVAVALLFCKTIPSACRQYSRRCFCGLCRTKRGGWKVEAPPTPNDGVRKAFQKLLKERRGK